MDSPSRHEHGLTESTVHAKVEHVTEWMEVATQAARDDPTYLPDLVRAATQYAAYSALLDPESEAVCEGFRRATEASVGLFMLAGATEGEYQIKLGDGPLATLQATGPTGGASAGTWRTGFYAAAICRDTAALDSLASIPMDVIRQSSTTAEECLYRFVEALQSFWLDEPDAHKPLRSALEATDPDVVDQDAVDYVLHVIVPEIDLLYRLNLGDRQAFDEAMEKALQSHHAYYATSKHKDDPDGFLALGPLGLASIADIFGYTTPVTSDYLPCLLVRGKCK